MTFFSSPEDLLRWVGENPTWSKAAQRLAHAIGQPAFAIEDDLRESVKLIHGQRDLVAAKGLHAILVKYELAQPMKTANQHLRKQAMIQGINHHFDANRNLVITADERARAELKEAKAENPDFDSDSYLHDVLEAIVANSELQWIQPETVGALTDAPMLGILGEVRPLKDGEDAAYLNFAGSWDNKQWAQDVLEAWGFMDYQVRSVQQDLLEKGQAVFKYGGKVERKQAAAKGGLQKTAVYFQTVVPLEAATRICPKLPRSTGQLVSTINCRENCLDSFYLDDEPSRVYCAETLWRKHVMDKFSNEWKDKKTGEWVGGYINNRFYVFPTAGAPGNPDVSRGNSMGLKLNERTRQPLPHEWSIERRMQEQREPGSTKSLTVTASQKKQAFGEQFLNSPEDVQWLKDTHLRGKQYPEFKSFIMTGNEDSPNTVQLFADVDPRYDANPVAEFDFRKEWLKQTRTAQVKYCGCCMNDLGADPGVTCSKCQETVCGRCVGPNQVCKTCGGNVKPDAHMVPSSVKTAQMVGDEGIPCELCGAKTTVNVKPYGSESNGKVVCEGCVAKFELKPCPSGCNCVIERDDQWCDDCNREYGKQETVEAVPPSDFERSMGVESTYRKVLLRQASNGNLIKLGQRDNQVADDNQVIKAFSMAVDHVISNTDRAKAATNIAEQTGLDIPAAMNLYALAARKFTRHADEVYGMQKIAQMPVGGACAFCQQSSATLPCTICGKPVCPKCKDMTKTDQVVCKVCGANVNDDAVALGLTPPATEAASSPIPDQDQPFVSEQLNGSPL